MVLIKCTRAEDALGWNKNGICPTSYIVLIKLVVYKKWPGLARPQATEAVVYTTASVVWGNDQIPRLPGVLQLQLRETAVHA